MNYIEAVFVGVSLAMDALAVSVALGAAGRQKFTWKHIALTAFFFGAFQFIMPMTGWFGGSLCGRIVQSYGSYIATALLAFIGGKMIYEAVKEKDKDDDVAKDAGDGYHLWRLTVLAFATSIDALLVGVSYACMGNTAQHVTIDATIIGIVTALISVGGGVFGRVCGNILGNKCEILGGAVLIGIALKVLIVG